MISQKNLVLIVLTVVAVALAALIVRDFLRREKPVEQSEGIIIDLPQLVKVTDSGSGASLPAPGEDNDPYREEAPVISRIPEANEVLPADQQKIIAVPTVVVPAAPGVESNFRNFNISGEGGRFVPEKIIAKVGDTVHVNFSAVDRDYDIVFPSYNMSQFAKQGQTKVLEFQALQSGSFLYFCESCGGLSSEAKGTIIIVE